MDRVEDSQKRYLQVLTNLMPASHLGSYFNEFSFYPLARLFSDAGRATAAYRVVLIEHGTCHMNYGHIVFTHPASSTSALLDCRFTREKSSSAA